MPFVSRLGHGSERSDRPSQGIEIESKTGVKIGKNGKGREGECVYEIYMCPALLFIYLFI
jgi:hypothetical protein